MRYAKVAVGLPVDGPFDYSIPLGLDKKIKIGSRVEVNFSHRKMVGYVVGLATSTDIRYTKPILKLLDETPILDKAMLRLTQELAEYYCCSWGEAIETALPEGLRKGRIIPLLNLKRLSCLNAKISQEVLLVHDLDGRVRWDTYLNNIKEALDRNQSVIFLLSDIDIILKAKEMIEQQIGIEPAVLYRKEPKEIEQWIKIKEGKAQIVVGARSSIFAPLPNLGLVIIDEEQEEVYKQDQVPHYHAREVAFMRVKIEKAKLILASSSPSLEMFYLKQKNRIKYTFIPRKKTFPEIKILNTERPLFWGKKGTAVFSRYLQDSIMSELNISGKVLLFLNRRGFSTYIFCRTCGVVLRCPRCNTNLVYHFKQNLLSCHYCNFKMAPPKICPDCNSGYIKYSGLGIEKIESELSRIFPQAKISILDGKNKKNYISDPGIYISTQSIVKHRDYIFGLVAVIAIDNSLNRFDFRASEKTFNLLIGILGLTEKKLIIPTNLPDHHCFKALEGKEANLFYEQELKERKQLNMPPLKHFGLIKLRGKKDSRVKQVSHKTFEILNELSKGKNLKVISVCPSQPEKLRGNFYWQILISASSAEKITQFLKLHLKKIAHSGIIVTVDIDPL